MKCGVGELDEVAVEQRAVAQPESFCEAVFAECPLRSEVDVLGLCQVKLQKTGSMRTGEICVILTIVSPIRCLAVRRVAVARAAVLTWRS